jgi:hypothetical protein
MKFNNWVCAAVLTLMSANVSAGVVNVWGDTLSLDLGDINDFYDGLDGHSSALIGGDLDLNDLTGVDLLWAVQPANSYTNAEISTMENYLNSGGRIAFMGEHGTLAPAQNIRINTALTLLGAGVQIQNTLVDPSFRMATRSNGRILDHPLTSGVNNYEYAAFAPLIDLEGGAEALMLGSDLSSVMMAYDNVGAGSVFLITDQNVWDSVGSTGNNDNAIMFENLLIANTFVTGTGTGTGTGTHAVPEPSSLALLCLGIAGLGFARSKKKS